MYTYSIAALAACTYLSEMREKIFSVLYKAINSTSTELQTAGKEAMRKVSELYLCFLYVCFL